MLVRQTETVHEFDVPSDVFARWKMEGKVRYALDQDLKSGVYNEEWKFDPSSALEMDKYKVK